MHPFGRGRERYFWAFVVGLVLFGLGGLFSIHQGIQKLTSSDHEISSAGFGVALILLAMLFEIMSLRTAEREANTIRPQDEGWVTFIRRTPNPEVVVVLLEDGAATLGLLLALGGVMTTWVTGNPMWDGVATVLIGLLLCIVAGLLTIEMKSLLIGETIPLAAARQLEAAINTLDGVERVLNLRTEHLGPDHVLICVKVAVTAPADLDQVVDVINAVEHVVHSLVPDTLTCYVEPDRL